MALDWKSSRRALLSATAIAGALAVMSHPAAAQEARHFQFDIPAQPLSAALRAYGIAADEQLVFANADLQGRTAPPLKGNYTAEEALNTLLAGTGLYVHRRESGVLQISAASDPQSGGAAGDGADQGTVQALVVTAQKREENIQDVPIAMSAFTQEDLTRSQVAGGPDLMTQVPNFTFTKTNFTGYSIQIRGIGTQAISATTDAAVAVAFNNTPFIRNRFFEQEFYDLERVEVLRGPQGTLYGRNATAGVVNMISAKPKNEFEAKLSGDVSNYSSSRLEGMVNLPLVQDKAALRIAGAWTKRDGFVKNTLTGQQTDGRDLWSARVTLGLTPTDNFKADLIWEHFRENDDRLRSGKQLCNKDLGPAEVSGIPVVGTGTYVGAGAPVEPGQNVFSQGCKAASLYSPDSFETPNGYSLGYYGATAVISGAEYPNLDPYLSTVQSRNLREIETHLKPDYEANSDLVELQLQFNLSHDLTLASETGFNHDDIFSFEDYNRFNTTPGVFVPCPSGFQGNDRCDLISPMGVFCDPQLGCTNRLAAGDLSTAKSQEFSEELRLSSDFEGPFNFSLGANFLKYDTEEKYYVFINTLTVFAETPYSNVALPHPWVPGVSDNSQCYDGFTTSPAFLDAAGGFAWSNPNRVYSVGGCFYVDPNNIHNLNDEGRQYFLSKNPYHLKSYAVFGEAYYNVTDNLKLTAGLRWTMDHKLAPQIPSWLLAPESYGLPVRKVVDQTWREPTGRLALDWKPKLPFTDDTLIYTSYVRGYKAGGANPPRPVITLAGGLLVSNNTAGQDAAVADSLSHPETFKAEFVNAYEIGTKNTLLDGKLTFNLNAFYYDYTGYQISQIVDRSAINLNFDANIWGSELETDWRPLENLRLGLKVGYEKTRLANGSNAIDLMDRTAGNPNYVLQKPFPSLPSNCIVPVWLASWNDQFHEYLCNAYQTNLDPATGLPYVPYPTVRVDGALVSDTEGYTGGAEWGDNYPGFDPSSVPNNGEGISKNLSGNELPNAPHITATVTADYTLPLPNEWLMTLHTDLYYQSEAWARVFNTPGYDKLKAYSNINVAAIFANEDRGWTVMAYVKNVLNKDNITGAFLNSDDTGLTTNVFLNEPRLYGVRVTKSFDASSGLGEWWSAQAHTPGAHYRYRVELGGFYGDFSHQHEVFTTPTTDLSPLDFPFPFGPQRALNWGTGGEGKITYRPDAQGWSLGASVRYGRALSATGAHSQKPAPDDCFVSIFGRALGCGNYSYPSGNKVAIANFTDTTAGNEETYTMADFMVGKEVGLGAWRGENIVSGVGFGLGYGRLTSTSNSVMHGRPDLYIPPYLIVVDSTGQHEYAAHTHRFTAESVLHREFEGAGPSVAWDIAVPLVGDADKSGRIDLDLGAGGALLFGKQKTQVHTHAFGDYLGDVLFSGKYNITPHYDTTRDTVRSKTVAIPDLRANLGLSYSIGGVKVSGGYRVDRYFKAIDGGIDNRKTYDRSFDGPYFKVSVGFGG